MGERASVSARLFTLLGLALTASLSAESCFFGLSDLKGKDAGSDSSTGGNAGLDGGTWGGGAGGSTGGTSSGGTGGVAGSASGGGGTTSCPSGFDDCDKNPGNGCEAELATSKTNCGACAHDCLGGDCTGGKCQPVLLAGNETDAKIVAPWNLALDASAVYFTVNEYAVGKGYVMSVPLGGGGITVLASGQDFPYDIALDSGYVYWTDANDTTQIGSVHRVPKAGGSDQVLASNEAEPTGITVDDDNAYWVGHVTSGVVRKVAKGGGTPSSIATGRNHPYGSVVDPGSGTSGFVYFVADGDGTVSKVGKSGGSVTDLGSAPNGRPLATDGTSLFFAEFAANGDVGSVSKAGQNATTLASGQDSPNGVAVDQSYVYFTNSGTGTPSTGAVCRVPKAGGSVETLVSGQDKPSGIAVDGVAVYWVEYDAHHIWKLAK